MGEEIRDLLNILRAYGDVLADSSSAVTYLLYTIAGIVGGWTSGLLWIFIGEYNIALTLVLMVIMFIALFSIAGMATSLIWNITWLHRNITNRDEYKGWVNLRRKLERAIGISWIVAIVSSFLLMAFPISPEYPVIKIPVAVNLGVGLGNLGMLVVVRYFTREFDPRQLFLFLYLILTIPSYFILVPIAGTNAETVAFSLLTLHVGLSNFIAAVWYILAARRRVAGILHAARG